MREATFAVSACIDALRVTRARAQLARISPPHDTGAAWQIGGLYRLSAALRSVIGLREGIDSAATALTALEQLGITGTAAAAWIRTVDAAVARTPRPDLVWSGPEVQGLHARDTRRVFEELLGTAQRSVWASTYAFSTGRARSRCSRGEWTQAATSRVTLLLNIQRRRGDTTSADQLVYRFAQRFWNTDWPGRARPRVYYDPRARSNSKAPRAS